ncbi:conserved protein of unknown function [Nitrosotalea devaniterrae]|uniref:Uncharacterized protein n=1 Tax=Nitrosotalea devaniterrae TaxID=1078905 RepID=A0A128A2A3_9ARCH|nr:conserved protein of unknown function [Candidatus Nitrosotalea devanaterra]
MFSNGTIMITKEELDQILHFVSKRWVDMSRDEKNKAFENMPTDFWMNSMGGTAGPGKWVTMLMYTEDVQEAESFKEVLLRWQAKHNAPKLGPSDLIQIGKK